MHYCLQPALTGILLHCRTITVLQRSAELAMSLCCISILDYLVFVVSSRITVHVHAL